jgi:hypothetical protein
MIEQIDERLKDWVGSILKDVTVSLAPPEPARKSRTVRIYLMEIVQSQVPRTIKRPPFQITLRYLVTAEDDDDQAAHRLLGELMVAALDTSEFEVESEPVPISLWSGFGVPPRPSFVLRTPLRIERPEPKVKRVLTPLVVTTTPMVALDGLVLGPGDFPLSDARVELPALQLSTHTDYKGHFRFAAVPAGPPDMMVRVNAKGREVTLSTATEGRSNGEPLVVRIDRMED